LNQTERDNTTWTVARLYEGFCDVDVLASEFRFSSIAVVSGCLIPVVSSTS
jgi:hypothetical protein